MQITDSALPNIPSELDNKFVYPIYYINLDKQINRKDIMERQFSQHNIPIHRISAYDGVQITNIQQGTINGQAYLNQSTDTVTQNEVACMISHLTTIKKIYEETTHPIALIMEDDISLEYYCHWPINYKEIVEKAPADWNIIKTFVIHKDVLLANIQKYKHGIRYVPADPESSWSAASYLINRKGMKTLIDKHFHNGTIVVSGKYCHADLLIADIPGVHYYTFPTVLTQGDNSSIENGIHVGVDITRKIVSDFYHNYYLPSISSRPKVFVIGFNKCGTQSIWKFFQANGMRTIHWEFGRLADSMLRLSRRRGRRILQQYPNFDAYLDMENMPFNYAHITLYKTLDQQYPGSKFILNYRDVDNWLKSRVCHDDYLDIYARGWRMAHVDVIRKWRSEYHTHLSDVREYFKNRDNLCEIDIETDDIAQKLIDFLPRYELDKTKFQYTHKTSQERKEEKKEILQLIEELNLS